MVQNCVAYACNEKSVKGTALSFHSFPADEELRKKWTVALRRKGFTPSKHSRICSKHFTPDCFDFEAFGKGRKLRPNVSPSVFDFPTHLKQKIVKRKAPTDRDDKSQPTTAQIDAVNSEPSVSRPSTPPKKVRLTYIGDFTEKAVISPRNSVKLLRVAKAMKLKHRKKLKLIRQQCRRATTKLGNLQALVTHLQNKKLISDDAADMLQAVDRIYEKLFSEPNVVYPVMRRKKEVMESLSSYHTKENACEVPNPQRGHDALLSKKMPKVCFVCDEQVLMKAVPLRYGQTNFSHTALPTKLGQLMGEGFMVVVADNDVLCTRCFGLLNRLDKLQLEVDAVQKALCGFLKSKYHLGQACDGLALESLQMLDDQLDETAKLKNSTESKKICVDHFNLKSVSENKSVIQAQSKITETRKPLKEVENWKKTHWPELEEVHAKRVKFSDARLSEEDRDCLGGGDTQDRIVVVHGYSDCEMIEDDDDSELFMEKQVYRCVTCGYEDSDKGVYEAHLRRHVNNNLRKCRICLRMFATKEYLDKHIQQIHKTFKCEVCNESFMFKVDWLSHRKLHKNGGFSKNGSIIVGNKCRRKENEDLAFKQLTTIDVSKAREFKCAKQESGLELKQITVSVNSSVPPPEHVPISDNSDVTQAEKTASQNRLGVETQVSGTGRENVSLLRDVLCASGSTSFNANVKTSGEKVEVHSDGEVAVQNEQLQQTKIGKNERDTQSDYNEPSVFSCSVQNKIGVEEKVWNSEDQLRVVCSESRPGSDMQPGRSKLLADNFEGRRFNAGIELAMDNSCTYSVGNYNELGEETRTSSTCKVETTVSNDSCFNSLKTESRSSEKMDQITEFLNSSEALEHRDEQTDFTSVSDMSNEFALQMENVDESSTVDDIDTIANMKLSEILEG